MNHRVSFSCLLSMLSPVHIVNATRAPVAGPTAIALSRRTIASSTCSVIVSCARCAAWNGALEQLDVSLYRSRNSTRAGDWASIKWISVKCANVSSSARCGVALRFARSVRNRCGSPGPLASR
ncbi:MAG: hypothetical protein ACXVD8_12680 [Actinomycetota bacterium]